MSTACWTKLATSCCRSGRGRSSIHSASSVNACLRDAKVIAQPPLVQVLYLQPTASLPDEIGFVEAAKAFAGRIIGHQQVTDAYLLGLALHKKGKLVTLDRGVRSLAGAAMMERGVVEIL